MKWPCGPLDLAKRDKAKNASPDLKDTLDAWAQPSALDLLKGTPVNCLVVEWAAGVPEDSAQQQALKPLLEAGRKVGISFVGNVAGEGTTGAVASAREAGLEAVMLAGAHDHELDLPAIAQSARDKVSWDSLTPTFATTENDWPGLKLQTMHGNDAVAGPTGVPWVNSNAWFSLLAKALAPEKTVWLDFDPPDAPNPARPANYAMAVADSRVYGSHWIISLADNFRAALLKREPHAVGAWSKANDTIKFFEGHRGWNTFLPFANLAVASDFRGDNAFMAGETLNLLNRRGVLFRVIERSKAFGEPLPGLKAVLWLDKQTPSAEQAVKSLAFVQQGGLLIAPTYWGPPGVTSTKRDPALNYEMYNIGKGQIAVTVEGFLDPYQVALDTHLLVSRRNDLVRLYNPETTKFYASQDPARKTRLVQIVNYAPRPVTYLTVWLSSHAGSAELLSPAARTASLPPKPGSPGTEFALPPITVNCAVEVHG
jgi:hypothetical protein